MTIALRITNNIIETAMHLKTKILVPALLFSLFTTGVHAQPTAPPPPEQYRVQLRYRIQASRNDRLVQYFAFLRFLDSVGFKKDLLPRSHDLMLRFHRNP